MTSCMVEDSADVNQDKIYTVYELFYNANTDKTWAIARFRFGGPTGTLLELKNPATVTFDGEELPFNALFSGHYKEYAGQKTGGTFVYNNVDGDTFTNSVPAYEMIDYPTVLDTINKSEAYSLAWQGSALSANQNVALFVGSWTWGDDALFLQTGDGATDIVMGTNQLSNLPVGPSTLYMNRSTDVTVSEGTGEGGIIKGVYRPVNRTIEVAE